MKLEETKAIIEAMLFAAGRVVKTNELAKILEMTPDEVGSIMNNLAEDFKNELRGIELIRVNDGYQLSTKKEYYDYITQLFDNRVKPSLSAASLEILSIIAYNPNITRAEIESIRGVNSDGTLYRLMEYNLVKDAGKADLPGKPTMYVVTDEFLKMFGLGSLDELPELPRYKLDENEQIVLEDFENEESKENE